MRRARPTAPIKKLPDPARPHRGQPVLRGLHPHPDLLRGGGQAAVAPTSSTSPPRAPACPRASRLKDTALTLEAMGADAVVVRHGASGAPHRLAHSGWIGGSVVNAGDGTHEHPTQALLDAFTMRRHLAGGTGDLAGRGSRSSATSCTAGSPAPTCCCCTPSAPRSPWSRRRRCCRSGVETWPCAVSYDLDAVLPKSRRRDDAAGPARADERGVLPDARASTAAATASTRAGWRRCRDHAIVMHPGPMNRGMEITAEVADGARSVIVEQVGQRRQRADGGALPAARRQPTTGHRRREAE